MNDYPMLAFTIFTSLIVVVTGQIAFDTAYWTKELGVTGDKLHDLIRAHGTHVDKIRAAINAH